MTVAAKTAAPRLIRSARASWRPHATRPTAAKAHHAYIEVAYVSEGRLMRTSTNATAPINGHAAARRNAADTNSGSPRASAHPTVFRTSLGSGYAPHHWACA